MFAINRGTTHAPLAQRIQAALLLVGSLSAVLFSGCSDEPDDPGCLGPGGVYARGKAAYPGANAGLICCEGLFTYSRVSNSPDGCIQPPLATFSCLEGSCGDGVCETGEEGVCGCVADCEE
jgi:hypothetical protein